MGDFSNFLQMYLIFKTSRYVYCRFNNHYDSTFCQTNKSLADSDMICKAIIIINMQYEG